ncbi:unnamed protein product [Pylaiella littoralis]
MVATTTSSTLKAWLRARTRSWTWIPHRSRRRTLLSPFRLLPPTRNTHRVRATRTRAASQGKGQRKNADEIITILDIDDDLADSETPLPLKIPSGYALAGSALGALTAALVKQRIVLRLGVGWVSGVITRQARARTRHLYDFRVFLDADGSTRSFKLPLEKYFMDGAEEMGSWALRLLDRCEDALESSGNESEEGEEFEERE